MAIIVEHDKRKNEILEKSLELFYKNGFDDVTFQKIADACGITRTTLYIYFKNKNEIFVWSIKHLLSKIEAKLIEFINDKSLTSEECLKKVVKQVIVDCGIHYRLFKVLLPYLISIEENGIDPGEKIRRRVLRIKHFFTAIIIRGQDEGSFKKVSIKVLNDMLYSFIETTIFRIAIMGQTEVPEVCEMADLAVDGILNK